MKRVKTVATDPPIQILILFFPSWVNLGKLVLSLSLSFIICKMGVMIFFSWVE